ncbi:MAG: hypothetical protein IT204_11040 [Fimbriimonadaceae bacterium]|nr:hypothetical protein [Fimbriimonadaceae bacterium]
MRQALLLLLTALGAHAEPAEWVTPAVTAPGLQRYLFHSAAVDGEVSFHLLLPPAYHQDPARRFPVIYWLHGSGGGLPGLAPLAARFTQAMADGLLPPCLVVFPNGLPGGMYCNWRDGSTPVETVLIDELLPHVDATWRTVANRQGRVLDGFSMGGYGAARLGFKYPELFATVSLLGAGPLQPDLDVTPRVGPRGREQILQQVYGGDRAYFRAQSPWEIALANAARLQTGTRLRQVIGDRDETAGFNRQFHEHLTGLGIPHSFTVLPGIGHNPQQTIEALGEAFWAFYREAFAAPPAE